MRMITSPLGAAVLAALLTYPPSAAAQAEPVTTDVTFNVTVRVEGNRAAIDTGIRVACSVSYTDEAGERVFRNRIEEVVPAGAIPPDNAGAGIPVTLTIPDFPVSYNFSPNFEDGSMRIGCSASQADAPLGEGRFVDFRTLPHRAISPATVGTCPWITGTVTVDGVSQVTDRYCADE